MGSGFQSINRTKEFIVKNLNISDLPGVSVAELDHLLQIFEKRHPIAHNLGVVDRKYIEKSASSETEGREVSVTEEEINHSIDMIHRIFDALVSIK